MTKKFMMKKICDKELFEIIFCAEKNSGKKSENKEKYSVMKKL